MNNLTFLPLNNLLTNVLKSVASLGCLSFTVLNDVCAEFDKAIFAYICRRGGSVSVLTLNLSGAHGRTSRIL